VLESYLDLLSKCSFCVLGLDVAQHKVGATLIELDVVEQKFHVREAAYVGENTFPSRLKIVEQVIVDMVVPNDPQFVVIEDYTNQPRSYTAFSMEEFGGIFRCCLHQLLYPMLVVSPVHMRSWCGVKPRTTSRIGKIKIQEWAKSVGFESQLVDKQNRENCTDAFVHAVMGMLWCGIADLQDEDVLRVFNDVQLKILYKLKDRGFLCPA